MQEDQIMPQKLSTRQEPTTQPGSMYFDCAMFLGEATAKQHIGAGALNGL